MTVTFDMLDQLREGRHLRITDLDEPAARRLAEALAESLKYDPLVKRYNAWHRGGGRRNSEPWLAAAEARYYACLLVDRAAHGEPITMDEPDAGSLSEAHTAVYVAYSLLLATPYLWRQAMCEVSDAAPLPAHVLDRESLLPGPLLYFSWEVNHTDGEHDTNWCLVRDDGSGIVLLIDDQRTDAPGRSLRLLGTRLQYGLRWPDDFADWPADARAGTERLLKRLAFLGSPYTVDPGAPLPHDVARDVKLDQRRQAEGRRAARTTWPVEPVHVITLRRPAPDRNPEPGEPAAGGREWQHQWWVRAHYRAQWYPSRQAHQVIWIPSFLKGPSDKPVIEHVYDVKH